MAAGGFSLPSYDWFPPGRRTCTFGSISTAGRYRLSGKTPHISVAMWFLLPGATPPMGSSPRIWSRPNAGPIPPVLAMGSCPTSARLGPPLVDGRSPTVTGWSVPVLSEPDWLYWTRAWLMKSELSWRWVLDSSRNTPRGPLAWITAGNIHPFAMGIPCPGDFVTPHHANTG